MSIFYRQHSLNLKCRCKSSIFVYSRSVLSIVLLYCPKNGLTNFIANIIVLTKKTRLAKMDFKKLAIIRNLEFVKACGNKLILFIFRLPFSVERNVLTVMRLLKRFAVLKSRWHPKWLCRRP